MGVASVPRKKKGTQNNKGLILEGYSREQVQGVKAAHLHDSGMNKHVDCNSGNLSECSLILDALTDLAYSHAVNRRDDYTQFLQCV